MKIISRKGWNARAPRSRTRASWSQRSEFIVHYSEGPKTQTVRAIQDFHMDGNGWSDIGYNFLVDYKGRIYEGRGWLTVGAHAPGHNTSGIGVCMIGRNGDDTPAAKRAIRWLYDQASKKAGRKLTMLGHKDVYATSCPGTRLHAWVRRGMPVDGSSSNWMEDAVNKLPMLAKGAKATNEHVQTLRGLLLARSHPEIGTVEGPFDATVEKAVKAVQKWGKVDVDGIVGPQTWPVLLRVHK